MEEVDGGRAGLRELARLPDEMVVCSLAGWTDRKHMLYLGLLQESFVNRLHGGQIGFRGLLDVSSGPKQPSKVDRANVEQEQAGPPCCGNQGDGVGEAAHSTDDDDDDDDASSTETAQERSCSRASAASSGPSSSCHSGKRGRSPSTTAEGSDQNFIDEETIAREIGESRGRRRSKKAAEILLTVTMDDQAVHHP